MKQFINKKNSQEINHVPYDTTENQKVLWLANQMELEDGMYNEPISIQIKGILDHKRLKEALKYIVEKHVALQMNFVSTNNGLKQIKNEKLNVEMDFYDLSSYSSNLKIQMLDELLEANLHKKFDLVSDPLYRFQLYRLATNEYLLHMVFYHIIFDGWSLGLLLQDLEQCYSLNQPFETTKNEVDSMHLYENILQKHQNYIGTEEYITSGKYWK